MKLAVHDSNTVFMQYLRLATLEELESALVELGNCSNLSMRERDRRAKLLTTKLNPGRELVTFIANSLRQKAPALLNAFRTALPMEYRTLAATGTLELRESVPISVPEPNLARDFGARDSARAVILVGTEPEHSNNKSLLDASNISGLPVPDIERAIELSPSGFCGIVVGPSAWLGMDAEQQTAALERICSLSSFVFVRIATKTLVENANDVNLIASRVSGGGIDGERFCQAAEAELTLADVKAIENCANLISSRDDTALFPLGLTESESVLLRLIANSRAAHSRLLKPLKKLGLRPIWGGQSKAKLFLLRAESSRPIVVKFDDAICLRSEVERHRNWLSDWEPHETRPVLYKHLDAAAVCYTLQSDLSGTEPAPTLLEALEEFKAALWNRDCLNLLQRRQDLETTLLAAARRLAELNVRPAPNGSTSNFWLHWQAEHLSKQGIELCSKTSDGRPIDLLKIALEAEQRVAGLAAAALVHGDIHGRNILLIDRRPTFIDYTASGPGNPFIDLVRLDAAVRLSMMRALVDEETMTELYTRVYVEGDSLEDILKKFPFVASCDGCRLSLYTTVESRKQALVVGQRYKAGRDSYLATVAVVSVYLFTTLCPGSLVERACLRSVASEFL